MMEEWNQHQQIIAPQHHDHASDSDDSEDYQHDVIRLPAKDYYDRSNHRLHHRNNRQSAPGSTSPLRPSNGTSHPRRRYASPSRQLQQQQLLSKRKWGNIRWAAVLMVGGYILLMIRGYFVLHRQHDHSQTFSDRTSFLEPKGRLYALRERLEMKRLEDRTTVEQHVVVRRAERRAQRTKPPTLKAKRVERFEIITTEKPLGVSTGLNPAKIDALCGVHARKAALSNPDSFPARDVLNSKSRVLITGILNPVGFHLALALKERCGVEVIGGVDPVFPNTVRHRLAIQKRIQILTTNIPKLIHPIAQPLVGLDPKPSKHTASDEHLATTGELNLLNMDPTHIVHLASYAPSEHEDFTQNPALRNLQSPYVTESKLADMFTLRSSMVSMEQVLLAMNSSDTESQPHFLYASGASNAKLMDEVMANSYNAIHDIYSVGIRLPDAIYGPWGRPTTPMYELSQAAISQMRGNGTMHIPSTKAPLDFVFVSDIVDGMIAGMQYRAPQATLFELSSDSRASVQSVGEFLSQLIRPKASALDMVPPQMSRVDPSTMALQTRNVLNWSPATPLTAGVAKTFAWHLDNAFPFGDKISSVESGDHFRARLGIETCPPDNLLCHTGRKYMPCLSECSTKEKCIPSIFDGIANLMKESTEGCDMILYTQSLGYNVHDLKLKATYKEEADVMICNFAFVPEICELVQAVIKKVPDGKLKSFGVKKTNDEEELKRRKLEALNGRLLYKGWILVWVKDAHKPLLNRDLFALKIAPGKLFSKEARHAVFVDEKFPVSPNHDDVLFLVSQTHRPPLPDRNAYRRMPDGKNLKYRLTAEPERRAAIVMSPLKYKKTTDKNGLPGKISVYQATKYMQVEIGENPELKETVNLKKQREFYERVPTFVNRLDFRSSNEGWYKYEFQNWIRTRWIVHDMHLEEARQIRCEWYQEHIQWDNNLDQLSFFHVMTMRELERRIAFEEPDDHFTPFYVDHPEYLHLTDAHEWLALESEENRIANTNQPAKAFTIVADHMVEQDEKGPEDGLVHNVKLTSSKNRNVPLFVRIVSERVMMKARQVWADTHSAKIKR